MSSAADAPAAVGEHAGISPSLKANVSWTVVGNTFYAGCQWAMLIVLAKLGSASILGRFSFAVAVCAPIVMFTNLRLRAVQATDAQDSYSFGHYLGVRLGTTAIALLAVLVVAACFAHRVEVALAIVAVGLAKCIESFMDVIYGLLQKHERMDRIATSMALKGLGAVVTLGLVLWRTGSLWLSMALVAVVWTAITLTYDCRSALLVLSPARGRGGRGPVALLRPSLDRGRLLGLSRLALPLGCSSVLESLNANVPRYYVQHYAGEAALGHFGAASYLAVVGSTVAGALAQATVPRIARWYVRDIRAYARMVRGLIACGAVMGVAGVLVSGLAGGRLLSLLYGPEYAAQARVLTWLMVAAGMSYISVFLRYAMFASRRLTAQLPLYVGVLAATTAACALLASRHGAMGVAWGMCIGAFVEMAASAAVVMTTVRTTAWASFRPLARFVTAAPAGPTDSHR